MRKFILMVIALLCLHLGDWGSRAWAQVAVVSTEDELRAAILTDGADIRFGADIQLNEKLIIDGKTISIDLCGHKLWWDTDIFASHPDANVLNVANGCDLTLTSSSAGGIIEGGLNEEGGAGIRIPAGNTVSVSNILFQGNFSYGNGGAIWNCGTLTVADCSFQYNVADNGSAIWNNGVLNMQGAIAMTQNTTGDTTTPCNLHLKSGTVINVTGSLEGSSIGVSCEDGYVTFTSGFATYNAGTDPATLFSPDISATQQVTADTDGEACITLPEGSITYVERSWNGERVVSTTHTLLLGQYTLLSSTGGNYQMDNGFYVVKGDVTIGEYIIVFADHCKLILCDDATLTVKSIALSTQYLMSTLPNGAKLSIYGQAGDNGRLICGDDASLYPAITSLGQNDNNNDVLNIHGGIIEATSPDDCAGIGTNGCEEQLFNHYFCAINIYGGTVTARGGSGGAGIGSGSDASTNLSYGVINIYGGDVTAIGGSGGAGIGGGKYSRNEDSVDAVNIYGGSVTATGGTDAAGIGSGDGGTDTYHKPNPGTITIRGGVIRAAGTGKGAGIGGGVMSSGYKTYIYGGHVEANGGDDDAAGIGGGEGAHGGLIEIRGGEVFAYGGDNGGAGIGGGEDGSGGNITISGGSVFANGAKNAAGIGGGEDGAGATVSISGGTILAQSGTQEGPSEGYRAIGPGKGSSSLGSLSLTDNIGVRYGINADQYYSLRGSRGTSCWNYPYAKIEPCRHAGAIVSITDVNSHLVDCQLCYVTSEDHDFNTLSECPICHLISFGDNTDNSDLIGYWDGEADKSVVLTGRTLYKDGDWNTLCLPFDVTIAGSPLEGATVMELDTEGFYDTDKQTGFDASDGRLYLYFKNTAAIEAGKPYLVKWNSGSDIANPIFTGVAINKELTDATSEDKKVNFIGTYDPLTITCGDKSSLFLSTDNTLYYPVNDKAISPFRAYFHVDLSGGAEIKAFVLNFDGTATGIEVIQEPGFNLQDSGFKGPGAGWYDLQGRKLGGKPATPGIYLLNGKKIATK